MDLKDVCREWVEIIEDISEQTETEEVHRLLSILVYSITSTSRKISEESSTGNFAA
jgi:hypothetical protein